MIKDSGNRTKFESGAVRDIQEGKGRCDLLPLDIIDLWCDDGLQGTLYYVGKYLKCKDNTDYFELILNQFAEEHQAKRIAAGENVNNKLYSLEEYRWNLVLELAKHFEEGAKKYGDRNWEKGIPCDRYIDSAVRHYCKWRAGWDDEPHDRAFIWNVVCCEWTRQQYGWNLEQLGEKDDPNQLMQEFLDKMGMGEEYSDNIRLNDGAAFTMTAEGDFTKLFEVLGIEVPKKEDNLEELKNACETVTEAIKTINRIITETISAQTSDSEAPEKKDQETADLKAACDIVERHNKCFTSPTEFCYTRACKECEYSQDPDVVHKAVNQLLDHTKKSLNCGDEVNNRYARNVTGGVELYDYSGNYVGYVHGFTDSGVTGSKETETIIRSIVESSWGLLTLNPFTLEKIIEDHGYISDLHFILELYKDPSDIKLPEQWCLIKRKTKEGSK